MDSADIGLQAITVLALRLGLDATSLSEALWLAAAEAANVADNGAMTAEAAPSLGAAQLDIPPSGNIPSARDPGENGDGGPHVPVLPDFNAGKGGSKEPDPVIHARIRRESAAQTTATGRALRPFKQQWQTGRRLELDIDATVQTYSRTKRLTPEFRSAPERWFDVDIVIDDSPTMQVWDDFTSAVPRLFRQLGFFRTVRPWQMSVTGGTPRLHSAAGLPTAPGQLQSSDARRLIVVVTDGAAAGWRRAGTWNLLRSWSASTPTALLTPLATRLWDRTGLALPTVRAGPGNVGTPNPGLRYTAPHMLTLVNGGVCDWLPLPIATFSPHMLGRWARTLMRGDPEGCHALLIPSAGDEWWLTLPDMRVGDSETLNGARIAETFLKTASPGAARLALLCAPFIGVGPTLLRLLGRHLVPEVTSADLPEVISEVMVGGLFQPPSSMAPGSFASKADLQFRSGVQDRLREILPEPDAWRVYDLVSDSTEDARGEAAHEVLMFLDAVPKSIPEERPSSGRDRPFSAPVIWGGVPMRNKNFTGRDYILERLREGASSRVASVWPTGGPHSSESDPANPIPQGVHGLGGVGKTAIAAEYAWRYQSEYDLVWWIPAGQLMEVRGSLAQLAQRLGLEASPTSGIDGLVEAVLDALRRGEPYLRWLLVFDSADQPEDLEKLIPAGPGDVLITSRNHRWEAVIRTVPLDVFQPSESRDFLLKRVRKRLSEEDADRLATELGHLPLALEQAGAMLTETEMPVNEYLGLLKEHAAEIMNEGSLARGYPSSMTAAWRMSVNMVRQQEPGALEVLRCCAFFGPEPIPRNVFRPGVQETETALGNVLASPVATARAMRDLAQYALITMDGNAVKVHRLIQALARDELTTEEQAAYRQEAHLIMAAAAPRNPDDTATWSQFQALLPHVVAEAAELHCSIDFNVRALALKTIRYLYQSGDYASALALAERFLEQWIRDSEADDENVLGLQWHLGNIQRLMGHYPEAYRVTEEALGKARRMLGENDPTTLSLRTGFGADLRAAGGFAAARELDTESRALLEREYGPEDLRTLRVLTSLAADCILTSQYGQAQDLFELAYNGMSLPASGVTALDVLAAMTGLSWSLHMMGKPQDAFAVSQEALDYAENSVGLGAEHLATLRAANIHLVASRGLPGEWHQAVYDGRGLLELATRRYGDRHPDTLAIMLSLSNLMREIGQEYHSEALAMAQSAAERYPVTYGQNHPFTYGCMVNLALLVKESGDLAQARSLDEQALRGLRGQLGSDHHYTLIAASNLASDLSGIGQLTVARGIGTDTVRRFGNLLGDDHPHSLACAANLAIDLVASGDEDSGNSMQASILERYSRTLGQEHPETLKVGERQRIGLDFDPPPI